MEASFRHFVYRSTLHQSAADSVYIARHTGLRIGMRQETPALTVNRLCGSGFQAVVSGAQEIELGNAGMVLCSGSESMSQAPHQVRGVRFGAPLGQDIKFEDSLWTALTDQYVNLPMALTAENLAEKYSISREDCDNYALKSQQRWKNAHDNGYFNAEIEPITLKSKKGDDIFQVDEHPRPQSTIETMAKLPAVFKKNGTVTAGNASGVCDGAAAILLASEETVSKHNLTPLARLVSYAYVGCDPTIMGIGPVGACTKALQLANKHLSDIGLVEVNEAFAAQYLAVEKELGLNPDTTNVNGGAIAVGHPLGASGTRITAHLTHEMSSSPTSCCPVDNLEIDRTKIHIDNRIRREIGNLKVWCKNKELGCQTSTELNYLQDHVEKCEYKPELCPLECGETIPSLWVDKHKKEECLRRMLSCDVCGGGMQAQEMMVHAAICPMAEIECEFCDTAPMTRKQFIEEHEPTCEKTPTSCMFAPHGCVDKIVRSSLSQHCEEASLVHVSLLSDSVMANQQGIKTWQAVLSKHVESEEKNGLEMQNTITALRKENEEMKDMIKDMNVVTAEMKENMNTMNAEMQREIENMKQENKDMENRHSNDIGVLKDKYEGIIKLHSAPGETGKILTCPFIWRVNLFKCTEEKYSPSFYTCVGGYKLCLCAVMDEDETDLTWWYIKLNLLRGEHDDSLHWPLIDNIRVILVDVQSEKIITDGYMPYVQNGKNAKMIKSRNQIKEPEKTANLFTYNDDLSEYVKNGQLILDITVK